MSKDHWDAILASSPLNATAGRVTARKKDAYEPDSLITQVEWENPPPLVKFVPANALQQNLIGHTFGRLRVVGYIGNGKWCCRCACGKYVSRSQKAALNPANAEVDRCTHCKHTAYLQREASAEHVKYRRVNGIIGPRQFKPDPA